MHEDQAKNKHIHVHIPLLSDDNSHNGRSLYSNYDHDTTLTSNPMPASSWEPSGSACVKRKERDNRPDEWAKKESHESNRQQQQ